MLFNVGSWAFHRQLWLPDKKWLCPWASSQWRGMKHRIKSLAYLWIRILSDRVSSTRSWETRSICMSLKTDMVLVCRTSSCTTPSPPTWSAAGSIRSHPRPTLQTRKARAVLTLDIMCTVSQGSVWVTAARWRKMCLLAEIQWSERTAPYQILWLVRTVSSVQSLY